MDKSCVFMNDNASSGYQATRHKYTFATCEDAGQQRLARLFEIPSTMTPPSPVVITKETMSSPCPTEGICSAPMLGYDHALENMNPAILEASDDSCNTSAWLFSAATWRATETSSPGTPSPATTRSSGNDDMALEKIRKLEAELSKSKKTQFELETTYFMAQSEYTQMAKSYQESKDRCYELKETCAQLESEIKSLRKALDKYMHVHPNDKHAGFECTSNEPHAWINA